MAMVDCFYLLVEMSGEKLQFILTETRQISNLRNQDTSKEILSNLVRKDFAKFSDKFTHFQYATLEIFK